MSILSSSLLSLQHMLLSLTTYSVIEVQRRRLRYGGFFPWVSVSCTEEVKILVPQGQNDSLRKTKMTEKAKTNNNTVDLIYVYSLFSSVIFLLNQILVEIKRLFNQNRN